jgi:cytochrome c556
MRKFFSVVTAIAVTLVAGAAAAQAKPEDVIKYRQSVYKVMAWNFAPMGAMVKGEKPYDKDAFARHALIVSQMSPLAMEGFAAGSDKGADTKAKPEVWSKSAEFKEKMDKMVAETKKLATVASSGTFDEIKKQFGATGGACKACHDDFRNK